jgi:hypothetical protein
MPPRDFLSLLGRSADTRRFREADIWTNYQVVRPLDPRGLTVVKSECNDQEIVVGNNSGLTFAPGASVMIGTATNRPGKAIIAGAPPGRRGTSLVPQEYASRTYGTAPIPAPTCPVSRTGRSYLGIWNDSSIDTLYAYRYADGEYQETLAIYDYSGDGISPLPSDPVFQRIHDDGDTVCFFWRDSPSKDLKIATWDVSANTLAVLDCIHPTEYINWGSSPVWNGAGFLYFFYEMGFFSPRTVQMYRVAVGASGTWTELTSRVGTTTVSDASGVAIGSNLMGSSATEFQVASLNYAESPEEVCIMHFDGSGWDDGLGRSALAGATLDPGNGFDCYAISGGRSIRITYTMPGFVHKVGIVPAPPGTPETSLLPADWTIGYLSGLALSPSGTEFVTFLGTSGGDVDKIVRLGIADDFDVAGCAPPQITVEPGPEGEVPSYMLCRD